MSCPVTAWGALPKIQSWGPVLLGLSWELGINSSGAPPAPAPPEGLLSPPGCAMQLPTAAPGRAGGKGADCPAPMALDVLLSCLNGEVEGEAGAGEKPGPLARCGLCPCDAACPPQCICSSAGWCPGDAWASPHPDWQGGAAQVLMRLPQDMGFGVQQLLRAMWPSPWLFPVSTGRPRVASSPCSSCALHRCSPSSAPTAQGSWTTSYNHTLCTPASQPSQPLI